MVLEFDQSFIQLKNQLPNPNIEEYREIPIIDLSPLLNPNSSNSKAMYDLVKEIGEACEVWGFFTVTNHGVPKDLVDGMVTATKEFFHSPAEEKLKIRRDEVNFLGYFAGENTKNVRDWKENFDYALRGSMVIPATSDEGETRTEEAFNMWPAFPNNMREVCMEYANVINEFAMKLLELIAMSLNLPAKHLNHFFTNEDSGTRIRLNYYPPCPKPNLVLGVGRHMDQGALTVLTEVDGVGGLDVKRKSDGQWVRIKSVPDSFIINCGDIIQVWTNDRYQSSEHRAAVSSTKERFSIPFFLYPAHYEVMKPLDELVSDENPPKYNGFTFGSYFKSRRNSNYIKTGVENAQIYHFRKTN